MKIFYAFMIENCKFLIKIFVNDSKRYGTLRDILYTQHHYVMIIFSNYSTDVKEIGGLTGSVWNVAQEIYAIFM